ncbi:hypothetical protein DFH29DRAFT_1081819 [Suillus ampliporus]|nr:hypothetical protein DFH29DRAFT_1081819 [Suillus ampliporus]
MLRALLLMHKPESSSVQKDGEAGLGAGGQVDATSSANANATHYATFAFFAFFSGSVSAYFSERVDILCTLRPPARLSSSSIFRSLPKVSVRPWYGIAQGSLTVAHPTEAQKGTFIGYFWAIFNLGGVAGSAVAFGSNFTRR